MDMRVNQQVKVKFSIGKNEDIVFCDIVLLEACHILLGRPWNIDKKSMHSIGFSFGPCFGLVPDKDV